MDKTLLEEAIEGGATLREIAAQFETSYSNVRYWMRRHDVAAVRAEGRKRVVPYHCRVCGEEDPSRFYGTKKSLCLSCFNSVRIAQYRDNKAKAIVMAGGQCADCGLIHECPDVYDFHHLDPSAKDPNFNGWKKWSWDRIEAELRKCMLLCRNCHAVRHWRAA